jgi:hypothetical protein
MRVPLPFPACNDNSVTDDGIPAFLRVENREPLTPEQQTALDKAMAVARASQRARDDLRALQREMEREKSRIRIEKLIAKKNGDTTRMPPTGKATLALIRATPPAGLRSISGASLAQKLRGMTPSQRAVLAADIIDGRLVVMGLTRKVVTTLCGANPNYVDHALRLAPAQRQAVHDGERPLVAPRARPRAGCWGGNGAPIDWAAVGDEMLVEAIRKIGIDRAINAAIVAERTVPINTAS